MLKKITKLAIAFCLVIAIFLPAWAPVQAAPVGNLKNAFSEDGPLGKTGERSGFDTDQRSVDPIIGNIISIILSFLGVIFLVLMIYGGYSWMTAMGNEEKVKKAQQLIQAAVLGLIVVVAAYAITVFVMDRLSGELLSQDSVISDEAAE